MPLIKCNQNILFNLKIWPNQAQIFRIIYISNVLSRKKSPTHAHFRKKIIDLLIYEYNKNIKSSKINPLIAHD